MNSMATFSNWVPAFLVTSITSWCVIGRSVRPDARFGMKLKPATRMPISRATMTSGTVDIPV